MPMPIPAAEIEARILEILADGPALQCRIDQHFAPDLYIDVGNAVRALARRGEIKRMKHRSSYILLLPATKAEERDEV